MGFNRRDFLLSTAAALGAPRFAFGQGTGAGEDKFLIVVLAEGGWDVTYCYDPKLGCSSPGGGPCTIDGPELDEDPSNPDDREVVRTFGNIPIICNEVKRPAVTSFFEAWHPYAHIINGIWTGSIAHDPCRYRILTGTPDGTKPDLATIHGYQNGGTLPLGSVDLSGWSISGPLASTSGRIGYQSQIKALIDPNAQFNAPENASWRYPFFDMDPTDEGSVESWLQGRIESFRALRGADANAVNDAHLDNLVASLDRSRRFREQSASILDGLRIGKRAGLLLQIGIAVDMLKDGLCRSVSIDTRQDWDTHDVNLMQHDLYQITFTGLSLLMERLQEEGILEKTVIAVVSEMTRTPLRNAARGKDHWGHTSALLLGAVDGNRVSGSTDHLLESQPMDLATGEVWTDGPLCKYDNLAAGILELVGVDPEAWLPGVEPFRGARLS